MLTRHDSLCERSLAPPTVHPAIELARVHADQVPTTEVSSGILAGVGSRSKGRLNADAVPPYYPSSAPVLGTHGADSRGGWRICAQLA